MRICVYLFGRLATTAETGQLALTVADGATCSALRQQIAASEPRLATLLPSCRFAVNHQFAAETQVIKNGDEVAIIGFVSGG